MKVKMKNEFGFVEEIETDSPRFHSLRHIEFLKYQLENEERQANEYKKQRDILYKIAYEEISRRVNDEDLATNILAEKIRKEYENGI